MLKYFKKMFEEEKRNISYTQNSKLEIPNKKIQIATCALFIEMANADGKFEQDEQEKIIKILKQIFKLTDEETTELLDLTNTELCESNSIYEFAKIVNDNFNIEDKYELLKNLWRLIYSDKILNAYEDKLIKNINASFLFSHKDLIDAKIEIRKELNLE